VIAYPVLLMAVNLLTLSAFVIEFDFMRRVDAGSAPGDRRGFRERFRARYRAHPKLATTQVTFIVAAVILLAVAAAVRWFPAWLLSGEFWLGR
jgi:hypothetical protein